MIMKLIWVWISERNLNKHFSSPTIYISSSRDTYIRLALLLLLLGSRAPGPPEIFGKEERFLLQSVCWISESLIDGNVSPTGAV